MFLFFIRLAVAAESHIVNLVATLGDLTDVIGLNQYYGWYEGEVSDFGHTLDKLHCIFPKLRIITSEYGAGAVNGRHSSHPRVGDFSEEYQYYFHRAYLDQLEARPWCPGAFIWNQFDFGAEWRQDGIPHLNNKGLLDFDRKPKQTYFLYKARWASSEDRISNLRQTTAELYKKINYIHGSSTRTTIPLDQNWYFRLAGIDNNNIKVNLPHSWNTIDAFDTRPGYHRGVGIYTKTIIWPKISPNQIIQLNINGGGQKTRVIVDGKVVIEHVGMFLGFKIDLTPFALHKPKSILVVEVDNRDDPTIPPVKEADYNIYGGLYRQVTLNILPKIHITGVRVNSSKVSYIKYILRINVTTNVPDENFSANLLARLENFNQEKIPLTIKRKTRKNDQFEIVATPKTKIKEWSPNKPDLYVLKIMLRHGDTILDEFRTVIGFKDFRWKKGELPKLNDAVFHFKGTARHQDKAGKANALTLKDHILDFLLIKQMGANAVRLAHYPQDPYVLDICDILGLLVWEEIPVTSGVPWIPVCMKNQLEYMPHPIFMKRAERYLKEMIRRDYNHVSILFWGLVNEIVTEHSSGWRIDVARALIKKLHRIAKNEDPNRFTAQAF